MIRTTMRGRIRALAAIASFPLAAGAAVPRAALASGDPPPNAMAGQLEQEFLRGMIPHHRGAVMMARMALEKGTHAELKKLAQDIVDSQMMEIAKMSAFLRDWYGVEPPADQMMPMSMMGMMEMPMMHGMMPDMETRMKALEAKSGADFEIEFLGAMVDHHAMALMMAAPVLINGHHADLYTLAEDIVISQGKEIKQMDEWLDAWYGVRRPV